MYVYCLQITSPAFIQNISAFRPVLTANENHDENIFVLVDKKLTSTGPYIK